jgi:hypothetical protein
MMRHSWRSVRRASISLAFALGVLSLCVVSSFAVQRSDLTGNPSEDGLWSEIEQPQFQSNSLIQVTNRPVAFKMYELDADRLGQMLAAAPREIASGARGSRLVISIPMPDGGYSHFRIVNSPLLAPALAAQHPELQTYLGEGIEDRTATARMDRTPAGFHAMILTPKGTVYVDPYLRGDTRQYMSFWKSDLERQPGDFICNASEVNTDISLPNRIATPSGGNLRTYRLAMTATGEYTQFFGGTVAAAQAAITTTVNRVNGIYEKELSIRLSLVAFNIYTNPATDPFPAGTSVNGTLLNENQTDTDTNVGSANYDIGHIVSSGGGGGLAQFGVCAANKAKGGTSRGTPQGDDFDVDYVAHEMGHQFHADHTFNGSTSSCGGGNRVASSAYEPGSGTTIMAYAGICGAEDVQPHSDPFFHTRSFDQIVAFREGGGTCGPSTATGNSPPNVNAGSDFTIPRNTPFRLTATGSDPDSDPLTFGWEQFDLGTQSPPANNADGPLFRSPVPTTSPTRTLPKMSTVLSGVADPWEHLPTVDRDMNFRCTARDNRAGGGGVNYDAMVVHVSGAPFAVTYPNGGETLNSGCPVTVTWTVGGGSVAANVNIRYSSNGGATFSTLAANTANDGSEAVTLPCGATSQGRIMVEAVGNIFFDVSNGNFSVSANAPSVAVNVTGGAVDASCQRSVTFGGTITDDCSILAGDVTVGVTLPGGGATLGVPAIGKVQNDGQTVTVTGSVLVSNLVGGPVTVRVTFGAKDNCNVSASDFSQASVFDNTPPVLACPADITVECSSHCGTPASDPQLAGFIATATDNCTATPVVTDDAPTCYPDGTTAVTFTATDNALNSSQCTRHVKVVDTTPPVITVAIDRDALWPPNHKLVEIHATVTVTDICDPNPTFTLLSITSNEPDNGLGDGDTQYDIQGAAYGTADLAFLLRSERSGPGSGRKYTIIYCGRDFSGNTAYDTAYVRVPHSQSGNAALLVANDFELAAASQDLQLAIPSNGLFDATRIVPGRTMIGNEFGFALPVHVQKTDVTGDGLADLALTYSAGSLKTLTDATNGEDPIGLHYELDGTDFMIEDLYDGALPVTTASTPKAGTGEPATMSSTPTPAPSAPSVADAIGRTALDPRNVLSLASPGRVTFEVFNILGQKVRVPVDQEFGVGRHPLVWDGKDDQGRRAPSGIYFYRVRAPGLSTVKRVSVLR